MGWSLLTYAACHGTSDDTPQPEKRQAPRGDGASGPQIRVDGERLRDLSLQLAPRLGEGHKPQQAHARANDEPVEAELTA